MTATAQTLVRTAVLPATPDEVWQVIGDFGTFPDWHPLVPPSTIEGDAETPGAVRTFEHDGVVVAREELLAKDHAGRSYRYGFQAPGMAITGYEATLSVHPHPQGAEVRWVGTYQATDDTAARIEQLFGDGVYSTGLAALRERFTAPPDPAQRT